jgi:hypothetical protein
VAKLCPRCQTEKSEDQFYLRPGGKYLQSWCKSCLIEVQSERNKERYESGPEYRKYLTNYARTRYQKRAAAGLCPSCGGTPAKGYKLCSECHRKSRERKSKRG